jgi:uncharacterized protein YwqG
LERKREKNMAEKLREYRMLFQRIQQDVPAIDADALGCRSKLGGEPDWDQDEEIPTCPSCGKEMTFVAQIDSIEHDEDHNPHRIDCLSPEQQYMFGDVGMIYVFFCKYCLETASVFQCG